MKPSLSSAPVFLQVFAVVLASVVATQALTFWMLAHAPPPEPAGFTVVEAARALRGEPARARNGAPVSAVVADAAPKLSDGPEDALAPAIRTVLARQLGVAPEALAVDVRRDGVPANGRRFHIGVVETRTDQVVMVRRSAGPQEIALPPPGPVGAPHGGTAPAGVAVFIGEDGSRTEILRRNDPNGRVNIALKADNLMFPPFSAALRRADGKWLVVEPPPTMFSPWQHMMLMWFALSALATAPLAWLLAQRLTRPIRAFAEAAERLGADPNAPPLDPEGPAEVRTAVASFNDMQQKLKRYVEERTAMIAAIAHDLRTPLTRLRFRAEAAPQAVREKMAEDIEQMDAMISSALAYARGEGAREARTAVDLAALASSVVDDLAELGAAASMAAAEGLMVHGDPLSLRRMLSNLVENAVKFGGAAEVEVTREGDRAVIRVSDRGPGLPEDEIERVFEPFRRLEPSRSRATGGAGLGLAVARSIARAHGGDVTLRNRDGGGLIAEARLPLGT